MLYSSSQTLRQILRQRPMAVELFETLCGPLFWGSLEVPLGEFCRGLGADATALLARIAALPILPDDTGWDTKPIHCLVDHLALEHAEFREKDLPGIESLLVAERLPAYPDGYVVKLLLQEFRYFEAEFRKHMAEEEEFLFPKILRNEACWRHPELGPEIHRGSVNLYLRLETHKPEEEFKRLILSIQEKLRNQHLHRPAAELANQAQAALDAFARRLLAHADLETNSLFPRAGRLEQQLYAGAAPGLSIYPGDAK